jgi:hypothetical protein
MIQERHAGLFFVVFWLSVLVARPVPGADIERIGDGRMPRLKVGPDGTMHVVASSSEGVRHHYGSTGAWSNELIAGTDNVSTTKFNEPFLCIAPDGVMHLVYGPPANMPAGAGQPSHGLFYAVNAGTGWSGPQNIVDLYMEYEAIETDASGVPLVVALVVVEPANDPAARTNYGGATWFRYEGGTWNGPTQLRSGEAKYVTLTRDGEGGIHLVMRWQYVHYGMYSGGAWHNLPDSGDTFDNILCPDASYSMSAPSIFVDPAGTVHVVSAACHEVSAGNWQWEHARYGFNDGSGWSEETPGQKDGERVMDGGVNLCSVAVDSTGEVHVFCVDAGNNFLHTSGRPGSWSSPEILDTGLSSTDDLPPFDAVFAGGRIHTVYGKPDGVYHLSLEPVVPPPDEAVEEAAEIVQETAVEEDVEGIADVSDVEAAADIPERFDVDEGEGGTPGATGGCSCTL